MRDYSLVKQTPGFLDMFAVHFGVSIDDIDTINQIFPEWVEGYYYGSITESYVNNPSTNANMKCAIYHNTEYDILIVGTSRNSALSAVNAISGLRASDSTGNLSYNCILGGQKTLIAYPVFVDVENMYLYCSQDKNVELPIIGIKLKSGGGAKNADDDDDDMRSDDIPDPEPDEPKDEPADPDPDPEPETRSTKKK